MANAMVAMALFFGAVGGAGVTWLVVRLRMERRAGELKTQLAQAETLLASERRSMAEKLAALAAAEVKLREAFSALSAEALRANNQTFLELARTQLENVQEGARTDLAARQHSIDQLVRPLKESLASVGDQVRALEKERAGAYATLTAQVSSLSETQMKLEREAGQLVKALRAPQVRGRWGEMQLKRVVELAGMLEQCDFFEQATVDAGERRLRPDLTVRLAGGKNVVVDSKVPLAAFLDGLEATDDEARRGHLRDYARHVRKHLTDLSSKAYWQHLQPTPEFVVCFLPGESFFSAALAEDPTLLEFGVAERVILATPTTLIALLRAVAYGWKEERLAANAQLISEAGAELYERIRILARHFAGVRKGLDGAVDSYNSAVGSLESRVLVAARRLKELGAGGPEEIPAPEAVETAPRQLHAADPVEWDS